MINRKYLPSKKFMVALYVSAAIILLALIFNYLKPSVTKYLNKNLTADTNSVPIIANLDLDSDNDGLPDWKENLYGTDPHKADTDGDGTNDADEIAQNRDPLKANTAPAGQEPNDKIDPAIIEENKKALEDYANLNEIDKFSRDLISNIIAAQPTSGSMSTDTMNFIISKSDSEIPQKNYTGTTKSTDLNLLITNNTNLNKNMTAYVKNYYTETQKLVPLLGLDMNIINSYILSDSDNATSSRADMMKITDKYQAIVNNLIKMPVPVAIGYYDINYHLAVINDLEKIIAIDKDIVNSDKKSLGVLSNLSIYNTVTTNLYSTLSEIDAILKIQR